MDAVEATLARHRAFWNRAEVDRPLLTVPPPSVWPPLQIPTPARVELSAEGYLQPEMLDPVRYFEQMATRWNDLSPLDGDQFRIMTAYWHVPWLEAICGCPVWYVRESGTMYSKPTEGGWEAV